MSAAGSIFGRYELLRLLAAGGMGEVYLARARSTIDGFGALVAIKVLVRNLSANESFVKMFLEEARVVGKLRHRNIVQVRDITQHEEGHYYMVMEYIPGQNLRELLGDATIVDRPLFEPRLGTEIFMEIADALAAAHAAGIVHRDVSPNNIMIGDEGVPKLIDFGVARAIGSSSMTNPGTLKGKFGYMAPEYVRSQAYDHRADLFSLGVVMWETFARRRLFGGASAAEQLHQLLEGEIPKLETVVSGFPLELAEVVANALERDPQRRIPTAAMLVDALTDVSRSLSVGQDPTLRKWLERRISGRLQDRHQSDQTLLTLPAGAVIPDFAIAYPDAGSMPGTYGFHEGSRAVRRSGVLLAGGNETLIPGAGDKSSPPLPTTDVAPVPARSRRRLLTIASVAAFTMLIGVVWLTRRGDQGTARTDSSASTDVAAAAAPASVASSADAGPDLTLARAHREIGLKAMADRQYAKAREEFDQARRIGGGGDDVDQLLEMAKSLEIDQQVGKLSSTSASVPTTASAPTVATKVSAATTTSAPIRKAPPHTARDKARRREPTSTATPVPTSTPSRANPPTTGDLAITSLVPKAVVHIDGVVMGQTPLRLQVTPGMHKLVVKSGDQVLHSSQVSVAAGETTPLTIDTPLAPKERPSKEPPKASAAIGQPPPDGPPAAPAPKPTPRVTTDGDSAEGARIVGACNACHARAGVGGISGRKYLRVQWERFFATGQHDRYRAIGDQVSARELRAARAFLRANAADTAENQGAGIRE